MSKNQRPTGPADQPGQNTGSKPRPGLTDAPGTHAANPSLVFVEVVLGAMLVFVLFVSPIVGAFIDTSSTDNAVETSVISLFFVTVAFQVIQGCFPWIHSRRRGFTIAHDWHFISKLPDDLIAGAIMFVACYIGAQLTTFGVARLVGLDDVDDASNTDILVDNKDSPWIIGIVLLVVVGAPLAEELLFRGFILRKLQRRMGSVLAIVISSLLFAIPHWQADATWQETAVLLSALALVGLVFAIGAVVTDRLGPAVIAHFLFNATGTLITLFG